ncbi:MAG: MFS transporter, partial [Actinobacteria bacterium]|nr:MFS transporter [Actinomycetota bacterium]
MTTQPSAAASDRVPAYPYPPDAVRRRQQRGWYFYDFANSTFSTTVITLFLGPYLTDVAQSAANPAGFVQFLGLDIRATSVFAFAAGISVLLQVLVLPLVGAIADRTERKRHLLGAFAFVGALATCLMFFIQGDNWLYGVLILLIANVAFGASIVVYNS